MRETEGEMTEQCFDRRIDWWNKAAPASIYSDRCHLPDVCTLQLPVPT